MDQSSCIGIAAHIYSARPRGPRGSGGLTENELKSPANGIWLCANHASLIDKHQGIEFPAERLHSYKTLHESRIYKELSGIRTPFTWINRVKVQTSPIFAQVTEIEFAQMTLIVASNSVGKTALCQWIASTVETKYLERWSKVPKKHQRLSIEVQYSNPTPHFASVSLRAEDTPEFMLDREISVVPVAPLKIIFPRRIPDVRFNREPSDLNLISRAMDLHPYEVLSLCKNLNVTDFGYFSKNWFEEVDGMCILYVVQKGDPAKHRIPFRQLGHSTSARFLMELGMLAARQFSAIYPTLLILDSGFYTLDSNWASLYTKLLVSPQFRFQSIVTVGPERVNLNALKWVGWKAIWLEGNPPNVVAHTAPRLESESHS